jgi:alkyldihydroxyacetonephosphate synthase
MEHMKWWGWGRESVSFSHSDKPKLAKFIKDNIDVDITKASVDIIDFDQLTITPSAAPEPLMQALADAVGADQVKTDAHDRVVHAYGKSLRDLVRIRNNDLGRLPDVIVYPGSENEVEAVFAVALANNAVIIPFGGGTNISGSLEAPRTEVRPVVSVDLGRMDRVLEIDEFSRTARIQAGALGPVLEEQLNARGYTLGHFPDSFSHSTIGGWVATRSSGMQSDKFGDIADITRAVRVVTPNGLLTTRPVPSTSTGPSVREMVLGSEGRLGIITEVTAQVHKVAEKRVILGYFFPTWSSGVAAMRDIAASDATPSVTRVSDPKETQFSFATKKKSSKVDTLKSDALKMYLSKRKGFDLSKMCLSFVGYEGSASHVEQQKKLVGEIISRHGGVGVGSGPGELYDQKKFDTPYIRDFLLNCGALADVSETSAPWSQLVELYNGAVERANKAFEANGVRGYIMCHLSHSYHGGACLYFTFAFGPSEDEDPLEQYDRVKSGVQQAFIDFGGTLSHHHAVGTEHAKWLEGDISGPGVALVNALFEGIDPNGNLNPGKIVR